MANGSPNSPRCSSNCASHAKILSFICGLTSAISLATSCASRKRPATASSWKCSASAAQNPAAWNFCSPIPRAPPDALPASSFAPGSRASSLKNFPTLWWIRSPPRPTWKIPSPAPTSAASCTKVRTPGRCSPPRPAKTPPPSIIFSRLEYCGWIGPARAPNVAPSKACGFSCRRAPASACANASSRFPHPRAYKFTKCSTPPPRCKKLIPPTPEIWKVGSCRATRSNPPCAPPAQQSLESIVLEDPAKLDAQLDSRHFYSQVPALAAGDRGVLDLLGITRQGRLVVIELKASEDLQLPVQAVDYWLRVRRHQREADFQRDGYFPGVVIDPQPPLVWLVSPGLRFHSATDTLLKYLSPEIRVTRIGAAA